MNIYLHSCLDQLRGPHYHIYKYFFFRQTEEKWRCLASCCPSFKHSSLKTVKVLNVVFYLPYFAVSKFILSRRWAKTLDEAEIKLRFLIAKVLLFNNWIDGPKSMLSSLFLFEFQQLRNKTQRWKSRFRHILYTCLPLRRETCRDSE
jgi:hypothetical protein